MNRISPLIGLLLSIIGCVNCAGFYTIVAPEYIKAQSEYTISLTLHKHTEPVTIRLSIEDGAQYKNEKEVTITPNKMEMTTLHIGDLDVAKRYKFVAEGVSGLKFRNESPLKIESKEVSIFIQTDKAMYKPGQTVKFRVLVLDSGLKPATLKPNSPLNIYFTDPENNLIKHWLKVTPKTGVFSSEIQLSERPSFGDWKFEAQVGSENKTKKIEVAKYVLPNFYVTIDSPMDFSAKDGKIRAIVRATYTYKQLVKGEAMVSLTKLNNTNDAMVKSIPINGKGTVEFDVGNDLRADSEAYKIEATVFDLLSGRNESASKIITLHKTRYAIEIVDLGKDIKLRSPAKFAIRVSHHDNSPILLNEKTKWITVNYTVKDANFDGQYESTFIYKFELNGNGIADVPTLPLIDEKEFELNVEYMEEHKNLTDFKPQKKELEINVLTECPTFNQRVYVEVKSMSFLDDFTYQVIVDGKLVYAERVVVPPNCNNQVLSFNADFDVSANVFVIVHYFQNDNIFAAKGEVQFCDSFKNFVNMELSTKETQPGQIVSIHVITKPESYVGLMAVDQSVLLMKEDNGLTKEQAVQELKKYRPLKTIMETIDLNYYLKLFSESNALFFTNFLNVDLRFAEIPSTTEPIVPTSSPQPRIRTEFPETWLWEDFDVNNTNGVVTLNKKVPDTITSWVMSAFSVNNQFGLGLTKHPQMLNVFQPFFLSLNLPYSVKRGEVVAVPVVLFNHLNTDVTADIVFYNENGELEFVDDNGANQTLRTRRVSVASNSNGVTQKFFIKFTSVGQISLKVIAKCPIAGDAIERLLQVDPEGVPKYVNKVVFVDLRETDKFETTQHIDVPANAVKDSLKAKVYALGDVIGGTLKNLQNLIRMPYGCGEQNMVNFVPDIVVLDYLSAVKNLDKATKDKAIEYLSKGYKRELDYRLNDGSFSVFGKSDNKGCTWLTAYVVKSFKQAETYINIDSNVIDKALEFLKRAQTPNGMFPEVGRVYDKAMQSGANKGIALTAYTTIAFLKNKKSNDWKYKQTVNRALENIAGNIRRVNNTYDEAIAAYALQLANHTKKDEVLNKLVGKALVEGDKRWWTSSKPNQSKSQSINVEITSYGLLALIEAGKISEAQPFFRWLLTQRNDKGGFTSTQDTVIGLEALATYSRFTSSGDKNVQLKVRMNATREQVIEVNSANALALQPIDLPVNENSISFSASGRGTALFQLSYQFNVKENDIHETFTLKPEVLEISRSKLKVKICSSFNAKDAQDLSNMVIVDVEMPTGFRIENGPLIELVGKSHVKLVETTNAETVAHIYFEKMLANEEICLVVQGYRAHIVAENKPVPVKIYDYYDT
ncbi:CD109 antigen-like, partial [Contarinia nasturtii]|uniref:CD109 antigen-like n=1 Tax=Contarinia nasturtii TaxID=265458 RepID=UPI0012D47093